MKSFDVNMLIITVICALITFLERALPFLVSGGKKVPETVRRLGKILPSAIIAALVVYCVKDAAYGFTGDLIPLLVASAVTVGLHLLKGNTFLSIAGGTAVCVLLMNLL